MKMSKGEIELLRKLLNDKISKKSTLRVGFSYM